MPRTDAENLALRAWASKPRVIPQAIPWKVEPVPRPPKAPAAAVAPGGIIPRNPKQYTASQQGYQRALFDFLWKEKAYKGKLGYERKHLAQRLQHAVDPLVNQGLIERRYDRFKSFTGKQKVCHLTLIVKTDLPEKYFQNLVTLSQGPA